MSNAFLNFAQRLNEMIFNSGDCCCCSGKIHKGKHDFMVREGNEIVVVKDVPTLICDTCGEVEYTLEVSREIHAIIEDFFAGRLLEISWQPIPMSHK